MTTTVQRTVIGIAAMGLLGSLVVGVLIGVAIHLHHEAERAANEAATVQNLKTVAAVQIQYYNTHSRAFGTFDELCKEQMLSSKFSGDRPAAYGYVFTLKVTPRTTEKQSSYKLNADPQSANTGRNHLYVDSLTGSIHVNADQPAGPKDPPPPE